MHNLCVIFSLLDINVTIMMNENVCISGTKNVWAPTGMSHLLKESCGPQVQAAVHFTALVSALFEAGNRHGRLCRIISAWLVGVWSWEVPLSTVWSELRLTGEEGESDWRTAPLLRGATVIVPRAAHSCIFIFSSRSSSIHYCQLIRCKADRKTRQKIH